METFPENYTQVQTELAMIKYHGPHGYISVYTIYTMAEWQHRLRIGPGAYFSKLPITHRVRKLFFVTYILQQKLDFY